MLYFDDKINQYSEDDLAQLMSELPLGQQNRLSIIQNFKVKLQSLLAWRLLYNALNIEYKIGKQVDIQYTESGKPYLVDYDNIHFNLSHCSNAVVCALSDKPIGVDVETIHKYNSELAAYICNEEELALLRQSRNPALDFTILWTKKESYCKLTGTGIMGKDQLRKLLTDNSAKFQTIINPDGNFVITTAFFNSPDPTETF